jgi:hypothetical protein
MQTLPGLAVRMMKLVDGPMRLLGRPQVRLTLTSRGLRAKGAVG